MLKSIPVPSKTDITSISGVRYAKVARVVLGLESVFAREELKVLVRAEGLREEWFQCDDVYDAEEVLKKYHSGTYIKLDWFSAEK